MKFKVNYVRGQIAGRAQGKMRGKQGEGCALVLVSLDGISYP